MVAVEVAEKHNTTGTDLEGWLVMGNYAFTDSRRVTLSYSEQEIRTEEYDKGLAENSQAFVLRFVKSIKTLWTKLRRNVGHRRP